MFNFEFFAVVLLVLLAFGDLVVGVINDAVNFLNSALGSKVATRNVIMIFASVGILIGATFSDGIIEVARKGIFHPEFFGLTEVIIIFTAVAFADIILLDLYSTFGLPTSTTVSIVFELFGAALGLAFWKFGGLSEAWAVINSASALKIVTGIILSIGIAFSAGLVAQFVSRLIFTFDYKARFNRYGFLWSGIAITALTFFILIKGGKHAVFMTDDVKGFIQENLKTMVLTAFAIFSLLSFALIKLKVNVLKVIVLLGTASLAMAFAGNDLANFIGVSVAGVSAFLGADLSGTLPTPVWVLILAGLVMIFALLMSKKTATVSKTEINITSHDKQVMNQWKTNFISDRLVMLIHFVYRGILFFIPKFIKKWVGTRWDRTFTTNQNNSAYDLIRASVNLMVAASVISYATSQKLPLSTTYVTFMVAMGTSLADGVWKKDCASNRINGVITVIGGWFITAILAFIMTTITVSVLYWTKSYGLVFLALVVVFIVYKLSQVHGRRVEAV